MLKKFILENIRKEPAIVLLAIMFFYFIYNEMSKSKAETNCEVRLDKKDSIIVAQQSRLFDMILKQNEYKTNARASDSLLREKTEPQVKQILNEK
ncbi:MULTISPECIES: hypothetical protein [Olivibacter]|jgi:hypothetical protein|uniref:Uncharacterized protein n=1 Tax=Olivibacter jilunii TaxID=985016 RepID=A0ABW6B312_9SPHI